MDILRRNTDYALRAMVHLAKHYEDGAVSTGQVAREEEISYQLACKLMQKLHKNKLVESSMGPKGGFRLSREPSKITLLEMIQAIQGPIRLNKCLLGVNACPRRPDFTVSSKLGDLQEQITRYLGSISLGDLTQSRKVEAKHNPRVIRDRKWQAKMKR